MIKKILITSALPYANGTLHFGHIAGAYLPADAYARFERLRGHQVLYICGSDEYGVAITLSAEVAGRTPKEHVDIYHEANQALFKQLGISFDHFSRTTWEGHSPIVSEFFLDLWNNGHIERQEGEQLFSEEENRFLADRYVTGICPRCGYDQARGDECGKCGSSYEATDLINPKSKLTGASLKIKKTFHYYLRFDHFKKRLFDFLNSKSWKSNVMQFASHYIDEIKPRAITRDLEWGVPVPLEDAQDKVFYVWFDAPIGYISATQEWAQNQENPSAWEAYWLDPKTKYVQFIGKDNIPFHAVFFPAMIMGQNHPFKIVDDLVANEFLNLEGRQFSKSEGWTIDLEDFFKEFDADQIRYYLAANAPESSDAEFTWKDFQMRCNNELVGKFGNLINRVLVFAQNHCDAKIPSPSSLEDKDHEFINRMLQIVHEIEDLYSSYRLRKASQSIMELAGIANAYFDAKVPWKDAKEEKTRPFMETTISLCLECLKLLALISFPIIPRAAEHIWQMLGQEGKIEQKTWNEIVNQSLIPKTYLPKPKILFKKIEDKIIEEKIHKLKTL